MKRPSLVILAAGASRRLGVSKALVRLRAAEPGTPLALLLAAGQGLDADPPLVVTGRHHAQIAAAVPPGVEPCANPDWSAGRTGGVRLAAQRRPGRDLCLAPVDVPLVPAVVFEALARAWEEADAPPHGWLAPRLEGAEGPRFGHPIVVGRDLLLSLSSWRADRPLRELRGAAEPVWSVAVASPAILDDLDGPQDLEKLRRRLATPGR